jgi:hypothetical protein
MLTNIIGIVLMVLIVIFKDVIVFTWQQLQMQKGGHV